MKQAINQEDRRALLERLRTAACLQISMWDYCCDIDDALGENCQCDAAVSEAGAVYAGKELNDLDLEVILSGFGEISRPADPQTRMMLRRAFQNAIALQSELWITASGLAETLNCSMEVVLEFISACAVTAETGLELGEIDLHALLGEPEADGYVWHGGPLKRRPTRH
jgi:hypothetical protein